MTCNVCGLEGTHRHIAACAAAMTMELRRLRAQQVPAHLLPAALSALDGLLAERQLQPRPSMAEGAARVVVRALREAGIQPAQGEVSREDAA